MESRRTPIFRVAMVLTAAVAAAPSAEAVLFELTRIAGPGTPVPDAGDTLLSAVLPRLDEQDDRTVLFSADAPTAIRDGLYTGTGGAIQPLITVAQLPNDFGVTAAGFSGDDYLADVANPNGPGSAFVSGTAGGSPSLAFAEGDPAPGRTDSATLTKLSFLNADNGFGAFSSLFSARMSTDNSLGLYFSNGGGLGRVVDNQTIGPDGDNLVLNGAAAIDRGPFGTNVVFRANAGLYRFSDGSGITRLISDIAVTVPGRSGRTFTALNPIDANDGEVLLHGTYFNGPRTPAHLRGGLYHLDAAGMLHRVYDSDQAAPGFDPNDLFSRFPPAGASLSGSSVAAVTSPGDGFENGLFTTLGTGELIKLVATGDLIDGKPVSRVDMTEQGLAGNSIAFGVTFNDFTHAVYRADVIAGSIVGLPVTPTSISGNTSLFDDVNVGGDNGLGTDPDAPLFTEVDPADQFLYELLDGPEFASVILPDSLGDAFDLFIFDGGEQPLFVKTLVANEQHFFEPSVDRFLLIRAPDDAEAPVLDDVGLFDDPMVQPPFVAGLTFTGPGVARFTVTPIPEPASLALLAGASLLLAVRRHR